MERSRGVASCITDGVLKLLPNAYSKVRYAFLSSPAEGNFLKIVITFLLHANLGVQGALIRLTSFDSSLTIFVSKL